MNIADDLALWVGGLVVAGLVCHFILHLRSPESRDRRKRRRSYGKVITKARRPAVRLSVQVPPE
jgi:hypothetical protein